MFKQKSRKHSHSSIIHWHENQFTNVRGNIRDLKEKWNIIIWNFYFKNVSEDEISRTAWRKKSAPVKETLPPSDWNSTPSLGQEMTRKIYNLSSITNCGNCGKTDRLKDSLCARHAAWEHLMKSLLHLIYNQLLTESLHRVKSQFFYNINNLFAFVSSQAWAAQKT